MSDVEMVEHEWAFMHREYTTEGKLASVWLDHNDREKVYGAIPTGAVPGCIYIVRATPDSDRAAIKSAKYTGRRHAGSEDGTWRLLDEAARAAAARGREHRALGSAAGVGDDLGSMTLASARVAVMQAPNRMAKAALIAVILRELGI